MTDFIIAAVVLVIVGAAVLYIYKAGKNGRKCIGCPDKCSCTAKNNCSSCSGSCHSKTAE